MVIAPKASGDIRLCVDMRKANAAIIRKRIPIPTVDEVLENLSGSAVFLKLDRRWRIATSGCMPTVGRSWK